MRGYHRHHVVPKHAGGSNDPSNMTCLITIEEHAEMHHYRYEMLGEWQDRLAWLGLSGGIGREEIRAIRAAEVRRHIKVTEETRRKISFAVRNMSDATRKKMSDSALRRAPPSEETRKKLRNNQIGKILSEETRRKMSESQKGKPISIETRRKQSESAKNVSDDVRRMRSVNQTGKRHSPQTIEKMRRAATGKRHSIESCQKMKDSIRRRKMSIGSILNLPS